MSCKSCKQPMWNYNGEWVCKNPYCSSQQRGQHDVEKAQLEGSK